MNALAKAYEVFVRILNSLQSPFLLVVRLFWGYQFGVTGWGKLHNLDGVTKFFASLNIPFPSANAHFVACAEFFGGILLALGLFSRPVALLLTSTLAVAYLTDDRAALMSLFSMDQDKFYKADPYPFLFAVLVILIFGPGKFALDTLVARWYASRSRA
jgi:putative oxidoreductase